MLFAGCKPEVAAFGERIIAVGPGARAAAGRNADVVRLSGAALPGLIDSHIHLEGLADRELTVDLGGAASLAETLARIREWAKPLPKEAWVVGAGWYNDAWPEKAFPSRRQLDGAVGGRPAFLRRKDGHSAWVSSAALRVATVTRDTDDPPGGSIDRDGGGEPTGIVRETAMFLIDRAVPDAGDADLDRAMAHVLDGLARLGLTGVHSMDSARAFASLQRLHAQGPLPVRVTYNLPLADLAHAERLGVRAGWGDGWLRFWGVKAFLDGSLGSRTAEMLDGSGTARLPQADLVDMIDRCARAELNVCLHAIGDGAVRRALDALQPAKNGWSKWRPRIEHAQCVNPKDMPRMARGCHRLDAAHPRGRGPGACRRDVARGDRARVRVAGAGARGRQGGVRIRRASRNGRPFRRHCGRYDLAKAGEVASRAGADAGVGAKGIQRGRGLRRGHGGRGRLAALRKAVRHDGRRRGRRRRRHRRRRAGHVPAKARLSFSAV